MAVTLAEIRTRAQRLADMENSTFVGTTEWNDLINEGVCELHELIVGKHDGQLVTSATVSLVAGQTDYDLPASFLAMEGVEMVSGNTRYTLAPFMFRERNRFSGQMGSILSSEGYMYQVYGGKLRLTPAPTASTDTLTIWYVPQATKFVNDGSTLNLSYVTGWERFIVLYAAIKALQKEESDASQLQADLAALTQRIASSTIRTPGDPKRIVDVRYTSEIWPGW